MQHCSDNIADRKLGEYWERRFCEIAAEFGFVFSPLQIGRDIAAAAFWLEGKKWNQFTLPDITIWTAPGQHHEIKHKNPTRSGRFGLEAYRFHALLDFAKITKQAIMYTIHNHDLSGGRNSPDNHITHWFTANVKDLDDKFFVSNNPSWVNGKKVDNVTTYYWPVELWQPLTAFWALQNGQAERPGATNVITCHTQNPYNARPKYAIRHLNHLPKYCIMNIVNRVAQRHKERLPTDRRRRPLHDDRTSPTNWRRDRQTERPRQRRTTHQATRRKK